MWDRNGSVVVMIMVAVMAFQAGREWQTKNTADVIHGMISSQAKKQDDIAAELRELAYRYDALSEKLADLTLRIEGNVGHMSIDNGPQTKSQPKP